MVICKVRSPAHCACYIAGLILPFLVSAPVSYGRVSIHLRVAQMADQKDGKGWEGLRSWLAVGISIISLLVASGSVLVNYLQSPISGWFAPYLFYGQVSYVVEETASKDHYGSAIIGIWNGGRAPAKNVVVSIMRVPKSATSANITVAGRAFTVERVGDNEAVVQIQTLPPRTLTTVLFKQAKLAAGENCPMALTIESESGPAEFSPTLDSQIMGMNIMEFLDAKLNPIGSQHGILDPKTLLPRKRVAE